MPTNALTRFWDLANKGLISPDALLAPFGTSVEEQRARQMSLAPQGFWSRFGHGVVADVANTASGFTSPLSLALFGTGAAAEALPATGQLAQTLRAVNIGAGAGFGAQGLYQAGSGVHNMLQQGVTPENLQQTLSGTGMSLLAAHGTSKALDTEAMLREGQRLASREKNFVYRAQPLERAGEGVKDFGSHAQATNDPLQALQYKSDLENMTGVPHEVVRINRNLLPPGSYQDMPHPSGAMWTKFTGDVPEYAIDRSFVSPEEQVAANRVQLTHSQMMSPEAIPALTNETRGQNNWVNFGPHMRDEAGNLLQKGAPGYLPPAQRPYAEQKAGVLPAQIYADALQQQNAHTQAILDEHNSSGGATFDWSGNLKGQDLWAVSPYPKRTVFVDGKLTANDINAFKQKNADLLSQPGHAIGTWVNDAGQSVLDVSRALPNKADAIRLAKKANQVGIYGLKNGEFVSTGGTGTPPTFWQRLQNMTGNERGVATPSMLTGGMLDTLFDPSRFDEEAPPSTYGSKIFNAPHYLAGRSILAETAAAHNLPIDQIQPPQWVTTRLLNDNPALLTASPDDVIAHINRQMDAGIPDSDFSSIALDALEGKHLTDPRYSAWKTDYTRVANALRELHDNDLGRLNDFQSELQQRLRPLREARAARPLGEAASRPARSVIGRTQRSILAAGRGTDTE
jgi:hypothetical protein